MTTEKHCSNCKDTKPLDQFWHKQVAKDKCQPWCIACQSAYNKTWWANNRGYRGRVKSYRPNYGVLLRYERRVLGARV